MAASLRLNCSKGREARHPPPSGPDFMFSTHIYLVVVGASARSAPAARIRTTPHRLFSSPTDRRRRAPIGAQPPPKTQGRRHRTQGCLRFSSFSFPCSRGRSVRQWTLSRSSSTQGVYYYWCNPKQAQHNDLILDRAPQKTKSHRGLFFRSTTHTSYYSVTPSTPPSGPSALLAPRRARAAAAAGPIHDRGQGRPGALGPRAPVPTPLMAETRGRPCHLDGGRGRAGPRPAVPVTAGGGGRAAALGVGDGGGAAPAAAARAGGRYPVVILNWWRI